MNQNNVWQTNEMREDGKFQFVYHTVEPERWIYAYSVPDPDAFILHLKRYEAIPYRALSRVEYEMLCAEYGVTPNADKDLFPSYGLKYGDFGMSHYHTLTENRQAGIEGTIHQRRSWGIEREKKDEKTGVSVQPPTPEVKKTGQLWEPCPKCGKEPVYMPLHLCKDCLLK